VCDVHEVASTVRAHPRPPLEGFATYEEDACAVNAESGVEREAVFDTGVYGCGWWWSIGEDIESGEVGLCVLIAFGTTVTRFGSGTEGRGGV
jgi:hypothetical protein